MVATDSPRVSILIPNFNNGRQSAADGKRDLIGDLLDSLYQTLADDPTPLEIIAYDDGSTDDSLETLRQWSKRQWRGGRPFLELIEAEHCGVLAVTANILSRRARGEYLARLDGDTICLTPDWVTRLCEVFDEGGDDLGVVGPKQLRPDLRIHAYGDFVLHPSGYTHVASGMDRFAVQHPMRVDHVMGAFYCCRKKVFEQLEGYDERFLRGQTVDFGLRSLAAGYRCMAVPHFEYIHAHGTRKGRPTEADTPEGIDRSLNWFEQKWGFSRIAPDLDEVARRYAGTPLLWNPLWFAEPAAPPPFDPQMSEWMTFANDPSCQGRVQFRLSLAMQVIQQLGRPNQAILLDAGDGLIGHLLAMQGVAVSIIEASPQRAAFLRSCFQRQSYPQQAPSVVDWSDHRRLPLDDGAADMVMAFDVLETHPNPVRLLRETVRVLAPSKPLMLTSRRARNDGPDPSSPQQIPLEPIHRRMLFSQLTNVVKTSAPWRLLMQPKDDPSRDMVLLLQRPAASVAKVA